MAGRNRVASMLLLAVMSFAGTPAAADEAGCAALAGRVKAGVGAMAGARELRLADAAAGSTAANVPAIGGPYTCGATAAVASRAFSQAVSGLNVRLRWSDDWIRPGDYCLGHYLDQCYPSHDRFSPLPPPSEFAFVTRAWRGVIEALRSHMPYGTAGDLSSFTASSLDAALSAELATSAGAAPRGDILRAAPRGGGPRRR